jgi:hypothetical protein
VRGFVMGLEKIIVTYFDHRISFKEGTARNVEEGFLWQILG